MKLELSSEVIAGLFDEAARAAPEECCGILLGDRERITAIVPARNVHAAPRTHFEIDPAVLIRALRAERGGGASVAGFYHSHPNGRGEPSATDAAMAAHDGRVWAIVAENAVRFWKDTPDGFQPLHYVGEDG